MNDPNDTKRSSRRGASETGGAAADGANGTKTPPHKAAAKKPAKAALILKSARIAIENCMAVKPGETVLIVTDEPQRNIAMALFKVAREMGNETMLTEMIPRTSNGEEPPPPVAMLMGNCDVVLCVTSKSLTHTAARREACAKGARVGTMPGITEELMIRCMSADYKAIAARSRFLVDVLKMGNELRITSPGGTDVTLFRGNREPIASTGLLPNRGDFGNLPSGETYLAPLEGLTHWVIVFDASMAGIGKLKSPLEVVVREGYAAEIKGGIEAERLIALVEPRGLAARNIAEFGIGTNDQAKITGHILEDEKVMGTVHIALGDNLSMGGTVSVQSHLDGLILKPTVALDGRIIMERGKLLV